MRSRLAQEPSPEEEQQEMPQRLRARLTYANVIATMALFVALGGSSYAAIKLPKNSVGSAHIKTNAVGSSEVKQGSLGTGDFKSSQLAALQGPRGPQGAAGAPGVSGYQLITESVPATATATKTHTVTCPAGKQVLGGGARIVTGEGAVVLDEAYPKTATTFYAETRTIGGAAVNHGLDVSVVCANVAP
jgi:hypothetical protein